LAKPPAWLAIRASQEPTEPFPAARPALNRPRRGLSRW